MSIPIDIKHRKRIVINNNGQRLTRIQGAIDPTHQVANPNMGNNPEAYRPEEGTGEKKVEETSEDLSLDKLNEEEKEQYKALKAKLNE